MREPVVRVPHRVRDRLSPENAIDLAHGGLRSGDHRRRSERRQHGARRRRARPAGDPARAGRPRRRRLLGLAAADPWRSCGAGAPGLLRVRAALAERDIWLRIAPHLVRPMRFAIPAHSDERPPWLLRSWLLLYDRLRLARRLPASATVDVTHHPVGNALKRPFGTAFEYSDCVVDDSRLVIAQRASMPRNGAPTSAPARAAFAPTGSTSGGWWRSIAAIAG